MKARIPFFMFLLSSLCIGLSLSAEEQEFYKPSDFRDISSCVISWEPIFGETKVFDLTKGEYPYPASGRYKAKEGWNSYPNGREIPVTNYSMEEEFPENVRAPYWLADSTGSGTNDLYMKLRTMKNLALMENLFPSTLWQYKYDLSKFLTMRRGIPSDALTKVGTNQWMGVDYRNTERFVDIRKIETVLKLELRQSSEFTRTELSNFNGLQLLCCYRVNNNLGGDQVGKFLLYDDKTEELVVLDGSGQSWRMPFFKHRFDTECWGCEHVEDTANFPGILFYDRNYGIPRNAIRPPSNDPETGLPTDNWRYWKPRLVPDKPQSRYVQINLKTGEVEATYEGIHYARLRTPEIVEIPNVARNGCLGSALMKNGQQIAFLPYDRVSPDEVRIHQNFSHTHEEVVVSYDGENVVDYSKLTLTNKPFTASSAGTSNISGIHYGSFGFLVITQPFKMEGIEVMAIYCYSIPNRCNRSRLYCCATVPADFIKPGEKRVLFAFNGESIFIDNSGELLRIDVPKEALR